MKNRHKRVYRLFKIITFLFLFTVFFVPLSCRSQESELRGVWVAWAGSNVPSKAQIIEIMDDVAAHNMNTVYVDVWRFGYPYFRSKVFHDLTGLWTDPALEQGRDLLAEFIAEGHRNGLHVEAWLEYGFVACQGNIDHLYRVHPEWFAKKRNGSVLFNGPYQYRWLSHCNPQAQQFLTDLCLEIIENYDVDGIELDRIRYPELDCGYDSATVHLFKSEHNGNPPPQTIYNRDWMRWRADKLTEYVAAVYDTIKSVRPEVFVSNAPIVYSYGYDNFCQDWRPWINEGHLDFVSPQVYRSSAAQYSSDLTVQLGYVNDKSKFYPGLTTIANNYLVPTSHIISKIKTTRNRGLRGHVIWFYDTLADDLPALKNEVYQEPALVPDRTADWRRPAIIINEEDSMVSKSSGWSEYTAINGFEQGCIYTNTQTEEWIEYTADIPKSGLYEMYCYNIYHWNAQPAAPYQIFHKSGVDTILIDQSIKGHSGWHKIGDYALEKGKKQRIVRLTNADRGSHILFADALMILNSNRPQRFVSMVKKKSKLNQALGFSLEQNFPNPFNPATTIRFTLDAPGHVRLRVVDITGNIITTLVDAHRQAGCYTAVLNATDIASGVYFYTLQVGTRSETRKMLLVR
ncbi:family 10 glycosylhydrolase [candidate division KSB1 bacterium]|nr:family 10 glycosylhydrolase [candidate division KSB1 bacterium]